MSVNFAGTDFGVDALIYNIFVTFISAVLLGLGCNMVFKYIVLSKKASNMGSGATLSLKTDEKLIFGDVKFGSNP